MKVILWKWCPETETYEDPREVALARPDQYGRRGGPICAICSGPTRQALDGEAWCGRCGVYQ
ncbi:MAG: hypothetical protein K6U74_19320 [Firmicutes bacterium]|nr:hypothetical protein [Bacillota bacterium]